MKTQKVVGYCSNWITQESLKSQIEGYTHVIFSFWISPEDGVLGAAEAAANDPELIQYVKSLGKKCILAAGGETYNPNVTDSAQAREYVLALAKYALEYGYDGVDFDIENIAASEALNWLSEATVTAAEYSSEQGEKLIISHAPQGPYFPEYSKLEELTHGYIDFYNIQYYNQGAWEYQAYESFEMLFPLKYQNISNPTSIESIASQGVPPEKIVLGKPITENDLSSSGFIPLDQLVVIIRQAQSENIAFGGVMGWKIDSDIDGLWGRTIAATLNTAS